ncbi:MAG: MBL fold metallo-hydrolase [Selenomonadaceae bacterium]|nr:MBL fold metallo-hydrolase [Selenomonadaceae bacterium]
MENTFEQTNAAFRLTVFGSRGSMPIEGENYSLYGGATSCYKVEASNEEIYLDAGSGIVNAIPVPNSRITVLLTHMHLDHIIGFPFFVALSEKVRPVDIYAKKRSNLLPEEAIDRLISPPFWPLKLREYPANVTFHDLPENTFSIGSVTVDMMEGTHPQGSTIYRLTYSGKSLVYATDFEHTPEGCKALADFSRDCDLLIYDAQYKAEEYEKYRGYGHSTPEAGLKVAIDAGAKKILFVHHAPGRTDTELLQMEREISAAYKNVMFAKIGDEISI